MSNAPQTEKDLTILDSYSPDYPTLQVAFDLFKGEWSSAVPHYVTGHIGLFEDGRVKWFEERCRGFQGKTALELGPLEAAHTYMLALGGASRIVSIESNQRAFLKCLIVQQALKFNAEFLLGDFQPYLAATQERFDFALCSGVLYHLTDPVGFLTNLSRVSNSIGIWTHYYDADIIQNRPELKHKFLPTPKIVETPGRRLELYQQSYLNALEWSGFCGGPEITSFWMSRQAIIDHLEDQGLTITIGDDTPDHPNGPCFLLYAER